MIGINSEVATVKWAEVSQEARRAKVTIEQELEASAQKAQRDFERRYKIARGN